jgi:hypothetical protein
MALVSHFNGSKKSKRPPKDADLREAAELLPSARREFLRPNFMPTDNKELEELGSTLLEWSEREDSTSIDAFFLQRKISPSRFFKTAERHEFLSNCLDIALANIASKLNEQLKNNQLYLIHKEKQYGIMSREEARLKREADLNTQVTKVYEVEKVGIPVFTAKKDKK